jgi:hypothetical protein
MMGGASGGGVEGVLPKLEDALAAKERERKEALVAKGELMM